ncbi:hypothetical protein EDD11_003356 [Mortierella claussenii]|nr:hypothetical protein EDD11_003356 [Mortierella claussenii]
MATKPTPRDTMPALLSNEARIVHCAIDNNVIAIAGTGIGGALTAVLLLKEVVSRARQEAEKSGKKQRISAVVVEQPQAVIEMQSYICSNTDARVQSVSGYRDHEPHDGRSWKAVTSDAEIVIITSQMLLQSLQRTYLKMDEINHIIFQQCQSVRRGHWSWWIMKQFYRAQEPNCRPRVLGIMESTMSEEELAKSGPEIEAVLECNIITDARGVLQQDLPHNPSYTGLTAKPGKGPDDEVARIEVDVDVDECKEDDEDAAENRPWTLDGRGEVMDHITSESKLEVASTGKRLTPKTAVPLIFHYCHELPDHAFTRAKIKVEFAQHRRTGKWVCWLTLPCSAPLETVCSGLHPSKQMAQRAAAFIACRELYFLGALNDRLLPHTDNLNSDQGVPVEEDAWLKVGTEMNNGQQGLSQRRRRAVKCFAYQPKFWDEKIKIPITVTWGTNNSTSAQAADSLVEVFMTIITIRPIESSDDVEQWQSDKLDNYRRLFLLTASKLPSYEPFILFEHEYRFKAELLVVDHSIQLSVLQLQRLHRYSIQAYKIVLKAEPQMSSLELGTRHILGPLTTTAGQSLDYNILRQAAPSISRDLIDWNEVNNALHLADKDCRILKEDLSWKRLKNRTIHMIAPDGVNSIQCTYYPVAIRRDLNAESVIPNVLNGYQETRHVGMRFEGAKTMMCPLGIKNTDRPLIEAGYLRENDDRLQPPRHQANRDVKSKLNHKAVKSAPTRFLLHEFCRWAPLAKQVAFSVAFMPSVLSRLDGLLKASECQQNLQLENIRMDLMLEALTDTNAGHLMSYERLELLGDSFLKFIISVDFYIRFPALDEVILTRMRKVRVTNSRLRSYAVKRQMYKYMTRKPPQISLHFRQNDLLNQDTLFVPDKVMADFMEAILGAGYLSGGPEVGLHAYTKLIVPFKGIASWNDFASRYEQTLDKSNIRAKSRQDPDKGYGDLSDVEGTIGYRFKNKLLLLEALTHSSSSTPHTLCYQRLAYLGDALLELLAVDYWMRFYPDSQPAQIHSMKAASTNKEVLGVLCIQLKIHKHILYSCPLLQKDLEMAVKKLADAEAEARTEGYPRGPPGEFWEDFMYPKIPAEVMCSVLAAVFVDSGWVYEDGPVMKVFQRCFVPLYRTHLSLDTLRGHPVSLLLHVANLNGCCKLMLRNVRATVCKY